MKSLSIRESRIGMHLAFPAIFGLFVFFLIPFCITLYYSLTDSIAIGKFVGFQNYSSVLTSSTFRLAAFNTFKFNLIAVPLIIVISFGIALLLHRKLRGTTLFLTIFSFPLVVPTVSVILFFQIIFSESGAANAVLNAIGFPIVDWLNSSNAFIVLVVLYIWKNAGYNIILFLAALNSVPKEIYEAADIDGAGAYRKLTRITVPLIIPSVFFIVIISIINSFKSFREAYILCGTLPNKSIYMLQHFLNNNFANLNYQRLSVAAILVFLVIFVIVFAMLKIKEKIGDYEM